MATNTKEFAAAMAVKAFLFMFSKENFEPYFLTGKKWESIKKEIPECIYDGCKETDPAKLEQEHLAGMNKDFVGLHIIGNVFPACHKCNQEHFKKSRTAKLELLKKLPAIEKYLDYYKNIEDEIVKLNLNEKSNNLHKDIIETILRYK